MAKNSGLFFHIKPSIKRIGKKYNYSLVAEVLALVFLGISEHPMNPTRWFILGLLSIATIVAFIANE